MGLEYIHAALLLHEAKKDITEEAISKILEVAGVKVDKAMAKITAENLKGVNIDEILSSAVSSQAPTTKEQTKEVEEKKEEKKVEEEKKEEAAAGLSALFG